VSRLGFVTAPASLSGGQANFARYLTVSWLVHYIHITEFFQVKRSLCVEVLGYPILAALLHSARAVGVSQTLRRDTTNGITELLMLVIFNTGRQVYSEGGHHVGHRPTFYLLY